MMEVIEVVKDCQHSIQDNLENKTRILHCLTVLYYLPVTVQHLRKTRIGRTVNALRKYEGVVGETAKNLVLKWKGMVTEEETVEGIVTEEETIEGIVTEEETSEVMVTEEETIEGIVTEEKTSEGTVTDEETSESEEATNRNGSVDFEPCEVNLVGNLRRKIETIDVVKHFQRSIEWNLENEHRILACIKRLDRLPITVQHLEDTGIGRTVNALTKYKGEVGEIAKCLVKKWKGMVAAEETNESEDEEVTDCNRSVELEPCEVNLVRKMEVIDIVKHYQQSIEHNLGNKPRLLHCIKRLCCLPVTVQHLQETGVGRTVNALRKYEGEVGETAKAVVKKWKNMVTAEETSGSDSEEEEVVYLGTRKG